MEKLNFQIGKDKYEVRDLTIQDYYDMQLKLTLSDQDTGFEIVSALSGCPIDQLKKIKYEEWLILWKSVQYNIHRVITISEDKFTPILVLNDVRYGMVNMDNISVGEFGDLDVILSSPNADKRMHEAIAILYRPIIEEQGKKYKIEEYDSDTFPDRAEEFRNFPLSEARVAITFFLRSGSNSLKVMLDSLTAAMTEMKGDMPDHLKDQLNQTLKRLQEDGTQLSSLLQVRILSKWKKPRNYRLGLLLIGLHGGLMKLKKKILKLRSNKQNIKQEDN